MPELDSKDDADAPASGPEPGAAGRPFWSGMLTFGLVSIPVDLLPATRNTAVGLRVLGSEGTRLERHYYCPAHDEEVPKEHIVRGYETADGTYVPVTDEELDALDPKKSREIDLRLFVPKQSVAPIYFDRAYLLVPSAESGKAYALLTQALEARGHAGIATFVMRDREYWIAIFATGGLLRAETLRFAEYVRGADDIGLPSFEKPDAARVKAFDQAIDALVTDVLPSAELEDEYAAALAKLAHAKARKGTDVVQVTETTPVTSQGNVIDLIEVLKQRLAESGFDTTTPSDNDVPANDTSAAGAAVAMAKPGLHKARATKSARPAAAKTHPMNETPAPKKANPMKKAGPLKKASPANDTGRPKKAAGKRGSR